MSTLEQVVDTGASVDTGARVDTGASIEVEDKGASEVEGEAPMGR